MHRRFGWILGAALVVAAGVAVADHGHRRMAFADDAERFDLSDLYDGETRTFGSGDHEIRATREGDLITLTFGDEENARTLRCSVDSDHCTVITTDDDGRAIVLKTGEGDLGHHEVLIMRSAGDEMVFGPPGDHEVSVIVGMDDDEEPGFHWISAGGEDAAVVHELRTLGGKVLRCPEGDTTMHLDGDDEEGPYFCPKHDLELEPLEGHGHGAYKVRVLKRSAAADD